MREKTLSGFQRLRNTECGPRLCNAPTLPMLPVKETKAGSGLGMSPAPGAMIAQGVHILIQGVRDVYTQISYKIQKVHTQFQVVYIFAL